MNKQYKLGEFIFTKENSGDEYWHSQTIDHRKASFDVWMLEKLGARLIKDKPLMNKHIQVLINGEWREVIKLSEYVVHVPKLWFGVEDIDDIRLIEDKPEYKVKENETIFDTCEVPFKPECNCKSDLSGLHTLGCKVFNPKPEIEELPVFTGEHDNDITWHNRRKINELIRDINATS